MWGSACASSSEESFDANGDDFTLFAWKLNEIRYRSLLKDRVVRSRIINQCGGYLKVGIIGGVVWLHLNVSLNPREDSKTCAEVLLVFEAAIG